MEQEARAARELGEYETAEAAVARGLDAAGELGTTRNELELLQLSATLRLEQGATADARARFELAHRAAVWLRDDAQAEQIAAHLHALGKAPAAT